MRFAEPTRMSEGGSTPVWARAKRRRGGGGGIVGLIVTLLALFGVMTGVLGVREGSLAQGGAVMDGWIAAAIEAGRELAGQAPQAVEAARGIGDAPDPAAGPADDAATP